MTTTRPGSEGKPKLLTAAVALIAMTAASLYSPAAETYTTTGVCLPPPELWLASDEISAIAACATIICSAILLIFLNKHFVFLKTNDTLYSSIFLLACGAQPALSDRLGSGCLILTISLCGIWLLLSQRDRTTSPTAVFLLFAALSAGSTTCWEFAVLALLFVCCTYYFGLLDWRGWAAILLGLITPYWLLIAFGVVDASDFRLPPAIQPIWATSVSRPLFFALLTYGITAIGALMCALGGLVRIYSQNARLRASSYTFTTLGAGAATMIMLNPVASAAWGGLLNICSGILMAQLVSFNNGKGRGIIFIMALATYLAIFIMNIYG